VTDAAPRGSAPRAPAALAPELEARIAALEKAAPAVDFDGASWFWMILLGVALPVALLAVGGGGGGGAPHPPAPPTGFA
jgi:hypothetical protein